MLGAMSVDADPVILEVALNGATARERNPHVPRTPAEITRDALACLDGGAAIVHNHHDEPMFTADGVHAVEPYLDAWEPVVAARPDALLYPTMAAGARGIPVERAVGACRGAGPPRAGRDVARRPRIGQRRA